MLFIVAVGSTGAFAEVRPREVHSHNLHQAPARLPAITKFQRGHDRVFKEISSTAASLQERLSQVRRENIKQAQHLRFEYQRRLNEQAGVYKKTERENLRIASAVAKLRRANTRLRRQCELFVKANRRLRHDLDGMLSNVTTAKEFVATALEKSTEMLEKAPELDVLAEMAQQEANQSSAWLREQRLSEIAGTGKFTFLQTGADKNPGRHSAQDPSDLLQTLMLSLDELKSEQNSSTASLNATFEKEFSAKEAKIKSLLDVQAELFAKRTADEKLNERLTAAHDHLVAQHRRLQKRTVAVRAFLLRLGGRPSRNSTSTKSSAAKKAEAKEHRPRVHASATHLRAAGASKHVGSKSAPSNAARPQPRAHSKATVTAAPNIDAAAKEKLHEPPKAKVTAKGTHKPKSWLSWLVR